MSYFDKNYDSIRYPISEDGKPGLRRAQIGAIHSIAAHFTLKDLPAIVTMPTGSGKTAVLILTAFVERAQRVLVITPSKLVRKQITQQFETLNVLKENNVISSNIKPPKVFEVDEQIKDIKSWEKLRKFDVVIGTPNSVSPSYKIIPNPPDDLFDLILIDEAHHSPTKTWSNILKSFPKAKSVLFTATPFRKDKKEIRGSFIYSYPLREAYKDKVFGDIKFIPIKKENENDIEDVLIAKKAEEIFINDKEAGFRHAIMVRASSKDRADELEDLYKKITVLNLKKIHSDISYKEIFKALKELKEGELDGIICVDMLGEGYDFPYLKIAAIHSPHKSLEVTLQFIGRFARTGKDNIGVAKFIAVPSEIEIDAQKLYHENAVWQEIIPNLSQTRIDYEVEIKEYFEKFHKPEINEVDIEDLSLYALNPYSHVKVYKCTTDIDITKDIKFPDNFRVVYKNAAEELSSIVYITKEALQPRWINMDEFSRIEYDLFIIFYSPDTKLLFINSTRRVDSIYEAIAEQLSNSNHKILPLHKINKVLLDLKNQDFFSIGMRNRQITNRDESYRTMMGSKTQDAVDYVDGELYHRGHIFCRAQRSDNGHFITLGYSSGSKFWSNKNTRIPELIKWCRELAEKLSSDRDPVTNTNLDILDVGIEATEFSEGLLAVEWSEPTIYKKPWNLVYNNNFSEVTCNVFDLDLEIARSFCDKDNLRVIIKGPELDYHVNFSLKTNNFFTTEDKREIKVIKGNDRIDLIKYLNSHPFNFHFSDLSRIRGSELIPYDFDRPLFDMEKIKTIDWEKHNVDIKNEEGKHINGKLSIHSFLKEYFKSQYDIVFYDHGSHEVADFINFKELENEIIISLYHCKKSSTGKTNDVVEDIYEVCGQVVKCIIWFKRGEDFLDKIKKRAEKSSIFIKGDMNSLNELYLKILQGNKSQNYKITAVQPAISKEKISDKVSRLLSSSNLYLRKTRVNEFNVLASK